MILLLLWLSSLPAAGDGADFGTHEPHPDGHPLWNATGELDWTAFRQRNIANACRRTDAHGGARAFTAGLVQAQAGSAALVDCLRSAATFWSAARCPNPRAADATLLNPIINWSIASE